MYVPDDLTLGNPGIFGFIGKAVSTVGKALNLKVSVGPTPTPPPPPAPMPQFSLPGGGPSLATLGLIGGAIVLGMMFSGRGRK